MSTPDDTASANTGSNSGLSNSGLSVDAAVFVPTKFTQSHAPSPGAVGSEQSTGDGEGGGKGLMEVPSYITSCYPFVHPSTAPRPRHPSKPYSGSGPRPFMLQDPALFHGGMQHQYPVPVRFPNHQPWVSHPQPAHMPQSLIMRPLSAGVGLPFDGGTGLLPTPPLGDGLLPTPPYPPLSLPTVLAPGNRALKGMPYVAGLPMSTSQFLLRPDGKKGGIASGATRGRGAKVSTGTQKETVRAIHGQPWARTLIMRDNSVQTDFHADIADLTLCEKASTLYRRGQRKNKGSQPQVSTDSEEVDSDSGYSSPLHRRNLVSNGTHPVRINALLEAADNNRRSAAHSPLAGTMVNSPVLASTGTVNSTVKHTVNSTGGSVHKGVNAAGKVGARPGSGTASQNIRVSGENGPKTQIEGDKVPAQQKDGGEKQPSVPGVGKNVHQRAQADKGGKQPQDGQSAVTGKTASGARLVVSEKEKFVVPSSIIGSEHAVKTAVSASSIVAPETDKSTAVMASVKGGEASGTSQQKVLVAPDFPVLRPAKRNEPPWSLTPRASKVALDSGSSVGVTLGVMSYASIVKSAASSSTSRLPAQQTIPPAGAANDSGVGKSEESSRTGSGGGRLDSGNTKQLCDINSSRPGTSDVGQSLQQPSHPISHSSSTAPSGPLWSQVAGTHTSRNSAKKEQGSVGNNVTQSVSNAVTQGGVSNSVTHGGQTWSRVAGGTQSAGKSEQKSQDNINGRYQQDRFDSQNQQTSPGKSVQNRQNSPAGGAKQYSPARTASRENSPGQRRHKSPAANWQSGTVNNTSQRHRSPGANSQGSLMNDANYRHKSPASNSQRSNDSQPGHRSPAANSQHSHTTERQKSPSSQQGLLTDEEGKSEKEDEGKKRPRRRRHRRRRRKAKTSEDGLSDGLSGMERTVSSSNISRTSDVTLHFDDDLEFPDISASNALPVVDNTPMTRVDSVSSISYSDILKRRPTANDVRSRTQSAPGSCLSGEEGGDENFSSQPGQGSVGQVPLSRRARKRRKRRELANRAAEAELAEISLEQQMLRELGHKVTGSGSRPGSGTREERSTSRSEKSPSRGLITDQNVVRQSKESGQGHTGRKLHQPFALNIADMLDAFEKKRTLDATMMVKKASTKDDSRQGHNLLDASAPVKRGKEREVPKLKKPSPLKKVILKEREEKKRLRLIDDVDMYSGVDITDDPNGELMEESMEDNSGNPVGLGDSDLSQDALSSRSVDTDQGVSPGADLSPISQTSPLSMSPLTPGASPLNSPIAGCLSRDPVVLRIHSRRFREYCTQILDKDIDTCCTSLLHELVRFQDRMYHKDPTKAKSKRRVVLGLREVTKHLKLKKIKCVIISPNLEKIQSKGGLDEALNNILTMCQDQNVPFVFALGRRALGRACAKLVPVSVAGIFNYEGCEEKFNQLISLTHKGREAYEEMKLAVEREIAENPPPSVMSAGSSLPNLFAHMGHSRTPSGCSAISFTSSVLSEPISENYPYAEPETDSKGYEIVRGDPGGRDSDSGLKTFHAAGTLSGYTPRVDDIDDGNEADVEDLSDNPRRKKGGGYAGRKGEEKEKALGECVDKAQSTKVLVGASVGVSECADSEVAVVSSEDTEKRKKDASDDERSESECESQRELPHIDSIHNSMYDPGVEILSQHSSRTIDNSEVLSTHSSRTLGESNVTPNADRLRPDGQSVLDNARQDGQRTPENVGHSSPARLMNSDRIQNWVEATQMCFQDVTRTSLVSSGVSEDEEDEFVEAREDLQDTESDTG